MVMSSSKQRAQLQYLTRNRRISLIQRAATADWLLNQLQLSKSMSKPRAPSREIKWSGKLTWLASHRRKTRLQAPIVSQMYQLLQGKKKALRRIKVLSIWSLEVPLCPPRHTLTLLILCSTNVLHVTIHTLYKKIVLKIVSMTRLTPKIKQLMSQKLRERTCKSSQKYRRRSQTW